MTGKVTGRARVRLDVYDLRGRLVKQLVDENLPRGYHSADWDGTDRQGRSVASGEYFIRIRTGGRALSHKVLLVR